MDSAAPQRACVTFNGCALAKKCSWVFLLPGWALSCRKHLWCQGKGSGWSRAHPLPERRARSCPVNRYSTASSTYGHDALRHARSSHLGLEYVDPEILACFGLRMSHRGERSWQQTMLSRREKTCPGDRSAANLSRPQGPHQAHSSRVPTPCCPVRAVWSRSRDLFGDSRQACTLQMLRTIYWQTRPRVWRPICRRFAWQQRAHYLGIIRVASASIRNPVYC
jgi:hypothetical protein